MRYSLADEKILTYLINLSLYFKTKDQRPKGYAFPLWSTILKTLNDRYSIKICRRTLAYHLKSLKDDGYVRVINRTHKGKHGNMVFTSCCFVPTMKAYQKLGITCRDTRVVAFVASALPKRKPLIKTKPVHKELMSRDVPETRDTSLWEKQKIKEILGVDL